MRKIMITLALVFMPLFVIAPAVSAQVDISSDICSGELGTGVRPPICDDIENPANPLYGKDGVLTRAISLLSIVTGIIAVIVIIIAGIKMTLSQGDSQKVSMARNQIIYAAVGVAVAIVAQSVVRLILNKL